MIEFICNALTSYFIKYWAKTFLKIINDALTCDDIIINNNVLLDKYLIITLTQKQTPYLHYLTKQLHINFYLS